MVIIFFKLTKCKAMHRLIMTNNQGLIKSSVGFWLHSWKDDKVIHREAGKKTRLKNKRPVLNFNVSSSLSLRKLLWYRLIRVTKIIFAVFLFFLFLHGPHCLISFFFFTMMYTILFRTHITNFVHTYFICEVISTYGRGSQIELMLAYKWYSDMSEN